MIGLVIIALIFLQYPAKGYGTCNEQQISAPDHQQHGAEKHQHGLYGMFDGDCQKVGKSQQDRSDQRHRPVGLRRTLPHILTAQKLYWICHPDLTQCHYQNQTENNQIPDHCVSHIRGNDPHGIVHIRPQKKVHQQFRQLGKQNPQTQTGGQADTSHHQALPDHDPGEIALVHAQDTVQSKFLFASADQKRMGVEQKADGKHADHHTSKHHEKHNDGTAPHCGHHGTGMQITHNIEHHNHTRGGEQIGNIKFFIFSYARPGQAGIKTHLHASPSSPAQACVARGCWSV